MTEHYTAPSLLVLICIISAMAFVVSATRWLYFTAISEPPDKTFDQYVWYEQFLAFIFVVFLSFCVGVYDYSVAALPLRIEGEVFILIAYLFIPTLFAEKGARFALFCTHLKGFMQIGVLCILGWGITIAIGLAVSNMVSLLTTVNAIDQSVLTVFIPGLMWNLPIILIYSRVKKLGLNGGKNIRHYLWPVLFAYTMLLIPLTMEKVANSESWYEMKNTKIIRRA